MGDFTIQFGRLVAYRGSDTQITIPDTVTVIGRRAFHFSSVTSVVLPDSVTEIEQEAFLHAKLEQVELGKGIKKIGANAFLCNPNVNRSLYPKVPISVFAKAEKLEKDRIRRNTKNVKCNVFFFLFFVICINKSSVFYDSHSVTEEDDIFVARK